MRVEKAEYDNNRFEVTLREGVSWVISLDKLKELHKLISAEITIHNSEYKQCEFCHGTTILCSGAGKCDWDGSDCNENSNCGEYRPSICKHCSN